MPPTKQPESLAAKLSRAHIASIEEHLGVAPLEAIPPAYRAPAKYPLSVSLVAALAQLAARIPDLDRIQERLARAASQRLQDPEVLLNPYLRYLQPSDVYSVLNALVKGQSSPSTRTRVESDTSASAAANILDSVASNTTMAEDDAISSLSAGRASKNQAKGRISDWTNQLKPVPRKPANGQLPKGTKGGASTRLPLPVPTSSPLPILDTGNQLKRPRNRSPEPKNAKPRRSHASSDFAASENSEVGALPRSSSSLLAKTIKSHLQSLPITNIRQGRSTIEPEKKDRPKRNQGPKSSPERRQANFDDHAFFFNLTDKLHRKAVNPTRIDDIVNFTDFDNVKYPVEVAIPGQKGEYWEARNQEELRDEKERLSKRKRGSPQTETTTSPHQSHAPLLLLSAKALLDNHVRTLSDNMFFVSAAAQGSNNKWSMVERNKIDKLRDKFMEAIHQAQYEYGKGLDELNVSFQLNKPQAEQESEDDGPWVPINRKSRNTSEKSG